MILYAATTNPGKLREFAASASASPVQSASPAQSASPSKIEVLPLPGLDTMPEPVEDAPTFAGNAALKAIAYSRLAPGLLVFADDSGLEVDALGGQPGVRSARFADDLGFEPHAGLTKDERNNRCVLSLLHEIETVPQHRANRKARFVCALALARDGEVLLRTEGTCEGDLLHAPRGANGFGYDPLFLLRGRDRTLAELDREQKWAVSHRGDAFRALLAQLKAQPFAADPNDIAQSER